MSDTRRAGAGLATTAVAVVVAGAIGGLLGAVAGVGLTGSIAPEASTPIDLSAVQNPSYDTP
ncbi:MAG: hypothetical protein ACKVZ6_10190 [Kineosporiaceae bacterium]|jgi:hypothetical protein